ncbi:MAG TPA: type IV secretory system conjugative DNA transfer family protein [Amaricoccus sp.]|uniref:type IV secretory system conjugative DNA transfer family protein n=1 Tax=Amaricoccus sp. TaxID=1872485 RepID=UPI002C5F1F18|nr:type IV secretory system conjugative DNA transfer family protein [Amaricoccus sp.]HMQ92840.1 type IV secretory system conjugative DNA transfer family protein [Amaricoccus sp.]HMR37056.1 type IV secretory system conjugative DNA transfer family protein [Paracoccus sp. (in: a-proteobacteria)]HMR54160.1 type IV secretory system conjugative DNA transfer family protein [Amaricoccus sp.]HMU01211.1 type IV secretory system conjugative DNA transfer family protein [Amaricoccus sp.]
MNWYYGGASALALLCLLNWRFGEPKPYTYGSAVWSGVWPLYKAGYLKNKGLRLGDFTGRMGVFYDGAHALTFGCPGSNKGTAAILPNLLTQRYIFLIDPGAENTAVACKAWRKRGYEFRCINPFGAFPQAPWALPQHGFNPLCMLDANSPTLAADAKLIAEMLVARTGAENGSSGYFKDSAESALQAMIVHIRTAEPAARQNLATLYDYVNADVAGWEALLGAMKVNGTCLGLIAKQANRLERTEQQAPEEFSAIMSTMQQDLTFMADPLVRDMLMRDEVEFGILKGLGKRQKGGIISVALPLNYIESHAAVTRLAMACAILELQRQPLPKERVLFMIDEAAALGKIMRFPNWLATLRKYRVSIWSVWQNVGQVTALYGKDWQTIVGNCAMKQFLAVADLETAEYTEKMLGRTTVLSKSVSARGDTSKSETARPLLMADELMRLKKTLQIVLLDNLSPLVLKKTPYWERPELRGQFHANPYVGKAARPKLGLRLKLWWGRLYYLLVCLMAPHPLAAMAMTGAALFFGLPLLAQWGITIPGRQ